MRVITNTAISLDGRIATARYDHVAIGTRSDRAYMSVVRAQADAVLVGGRTFRNWPLPLVPDYSAIAGLASAGFPGLPPDCLTPGPRQRWLNVVLSRELDLPRTGRFYEEPRVQPLFFSPSSRPMPVEVVVAEVSPLRVVEELERRGVETLLIEAGGALIHDFLAAERDGRPLVDELYVTLCPLIIGGVGAPSLVDGAGFTAATLRHLDLVSQVRWGDELFLRYATRRGSPRPVGP
ncbi:MAG: RibD family protein [Myxococcales bacterium]|nr:RibD family protein [Myxococcales bacterium]